MSKILIADDNRASARLLEAVLCREGHDCTTVDDGREAWDQVQRGAWDAVLTDWQMPEVDGLELARRIRSGAGEQPVIVLLTAHEDDALDHKARAAGVDEVVHKPYDVNKVIRAIAAGAAGTVGESPTGSRLDREAARQIVPPFVGCCVAASTGGPQAVLEVFGQLVPHPEVAYFVVVHAPGWMLHKFADRLARLDRMPVQLAADQQMVRPGQLYLAPGDRHLALAGPTPRTRLLDTPPVHYVKPAADVLFETAASAFGRHLAGVVLTGLGKDGAAGCGVIHDIGGYVLVEDPDTATAPPMPTAAREAVPSAPAVPLADLAATLQFELTARVRDRRRAGTERLRAKRVG